jgi:dolichol-phosphate mannosyltransferase
LYWITAGSYQLFGQTEVAARIPAALAATLTVLLSFLLGRRLVGDAVAWCGALLMFLCVGFILSSRFLLMDGLLTLFTTTCLMSALLATRGRRIRIGWWLLAAVACALGVLTKGPIAVVLACPPLLLLHWLDRRRARPAVTHWLLFATVITCLVLPWFAIVGQQQQDFAGHFFWQHHIVRFFSAFNHQEPFWYYVPVLFVGMFPSSLLAAAALCFLLHRGRDLRERRNLELGALVLSAGWILMFFSLSSCKLPTYILPAVPMLCMLQAGALLTMWDCRCPHTLLRGFATHLPAHTTGIALVAGATIAIIDLFLNRAPALGGLIDVLVILLAAGFLAYRAVRRQPWELGPTSWIVSASVCLLVMAFAFQQFMPEFAEYRSINANAARLRKDSGTEALPVVYYDWDTDAATFYLEPDGIHRFAFEQLEDATAFVARHPEVVVVADHNQLRRLRAALGERADFTAVRGARGRLYVATARQPVLTGSRPATRKSR